MKRFVVGLYSLFDNELELKEVIGADELSTLKAVLQTEGWSELDDCETVEDLKNLAFNGDLGVNILEIDAEPEKHIAALLKP